MLHENLLNCKYELVYLEEHVSRFYSAVSSYSSSLHDRADVDASITPVITLTNNTNTQKVVLLCQAENTELVLHKNVDSHIMDGLLNRPGCLWATVSV